MMRMPTAWPFCQTPQHAADGRHGIAVVPCGAVMPLSVGMSRLAGRLAAAMLHLLVPRPPLSMAAAAAAAVQLLLCSLSTAPLAAA